MSKKVVSARGKLLGLMHAGGQWVPIVQSFTTTHKRDSVLVSVCGMDDLNPSARRKADRWLDQLEPRSRGVA